MHQTQRFDVPRLIRRFNGPAQLHRRLRGRGHDVTVKMIEKWRERDRIPPDWLAEMVLMAAEEGRPLDLSAYLRRDDEPADSDADDVLA